MSDTFTGIAGREKDSFRPRAVGSFQNREEGRQERRRFHATEAFIRVRLPHPSLKTVSTKPAPDLWRR